MISMHNDALQSQTGNEFGFEWAIGCKFDNGLMIGVVAYANRGLTGDSGPCGPSKGSGRALAFFTAAFPALQALEKPFK